MHKKHFIFILLSHLVMVGSLFAPLIRVSENRLNNTGITLIDTNYVNIFQYVYNDIYTVTAVFMIILALISITGAVLAILLIFLSVEKTVGRKQAIIKSRQGVEVTDEQTPLNEKDSTAWEKEMAEGEAYYQKIQAELSGK